MLVFSVFAQKSWTVSTVPNTRLKGNEIHVSDPDGYLSDSIEMTINTALCAIRDTADVFVVTLTSIGEAEPKHFATELFNHWGIGDAGKDNGVLLLFVEDQHALEFETGYGAEATLTDAKCERIFTRTIVPYFRAGDYEGGLCAGVTEIVSVYGGTIPDGLMNFLPTTTEADYVDDAPDFSEYGTFTIIAFMLMIFMPIVGLVYWAKKRKEKTMKADTATLSYEDGVTYLEGTKTSWSGSPWEGKGCLGALMMGFSLFLFFFPAFVFISMRFPDMAEKSQFNWASLIALVLYLTWMCFRQGHRTLKAADSLASASINPKGVYKVALDHSANKIAFWMAPWLGWVYYTKLKLRMEQSADCQCPTCRAKMQKDGSFVLPEIHAFENRIGAMNFRPYRCMNGHTVVVKEHGSQFANYTTCEHCGALASKKTSSETIKAASYSQKGEKLETYKCDHCGHTFKKTVEIPMLVHYSSGGGSSYSSGSSGRSYSSHSSSHSSGGSFGGGHSGGGGYSGRW